MSEQTHNPIIPHLLFAAHPPDLKAFLVEKGCFNKNTKIVMRELLDAVDRRETTRIHEVDPHAGITNYISANVIADESCLCLRLVQAALAELKEKKVIEIIDRLEYKKIPRYKLNCYQPALDYLQANPDHPKCKVAQLVPSPEQEESYRESLQNTYAHAAYPTDVEYANTAGTYAHAAYIKEFKNLEAPGLTGSSNVTGDGPETAAENRGDLKSSQRQKPVNAGCDFLPVLVDEPVEEEPKDSPKEKPVAEPQSVSSPLAITPVSELAAEPDSQKETESTDAPSLPPKVPPAANLNVKGDLDAKVPPETDEEAESPPRQEDQPSNPERRHTSGPRDAEKARPAPPPIDEPNAPRPTHQRDQEKSEKPVAAPSGELDIVPNGHIGDYIDFMANEKSMNPRSKVKDPDPDEEFVRLFYEQPPVIVDYKDLRRAQKLKQNLIEKMQSRGIDLPPLRLFKKIMEETKQRTTQGKAPPKSLNYFHEHSDGEAIVDFCLDLHRGETKAKSEIERTSTYLNELKTGRPANPTTPKPSLRDKTANMQVEPWLKEMSERNMSEAAS